MTVTISVYGEDEEIVHFAKHDIFKISDVRLMVFLTTWEKISAKCTNYARDMLGLKMSTV